MRMETLAAASAAVVAGLYGYGRLVERIPRTAKKTIAAIRSVRAVRDELRKWRE